VHTGVWWANLRERDPLGYLDVDGEGNTKINFNERLFGACTGLVWLRMGAEGGLL